MVVVVDTNEKSVHQFFKSKCNVDWATRLASGGPSPFIALLFTTPLSHLFRCKGYLHLKYWQIDWD